MFCVRSLFSTSGGVAARLSAEHAQPRSGAAPVQRGQQEAVPEEAGRPGE